MNLDTGIHQNHLRAPPSTSEHVRAPPSTFDSGELRPTQRVPLALSTRHGVDSSESCAPHPKPEHLPPSPQHTSRRRFIGIVLPPPQARARASTREHARARRIPANCDRRSTSPLALSTRHGVDSSESHHPEPDVSCRSPDSGHAWKEMRLLWPCVSHRLQSRSVWAP